MGKRHVGRNTYGWFSPVPDGLVPGPGTDECGLGALGSTPGSRGKVKEYRRLADTPNSRFVVGGCRLGTSPDTNEAGPQPRTWSGPTRIWALSAGLSGLAVAALFVLPDTPLLADRAIPWWLLAAGFYGAELLIVHLRFGRDAHTFSMSEIPLVMGLVTVAPVTLVAAQVVGNLAVLAAHRRQTSYKLAFNLSEYALQTTIAIAVYRGIVRGDTVFAAIGWAGAILAAMCALGAAHAMVYTAIRLTG